MRELCKYLILTLSALFLCGCIGKEETQGRSRLEAFSDRYSQGSPVRGKEGPAPAVRVDTAVFFTTVEFPEGYDWRRDTSYGGVAGRLVLYRDGVSAVSVPAGPSFRAGLDPDMHHLFGGHIYTEYCTDGLTVIGKDGEECFSYPGREFLCGLLVEGTDIYTLGQNRSGSGFSLRRNGEEMLSSAAGMVASHISDDPDYPSGALYRDGERLCFSYWQYAQDGSGREWYIVEDGETTRVETGKNGMYDIRLRGGELSVRPMMAASKKFWTYSDGAYNASVTVRRDGSMSVSAPSSSSAYDFRSLRMFSFRNAFLFGPHFYIGLNPLEEGEKPSLWKDGETFIQLDINGFITAVEACRVLSD